jgi:single-strand DNA-binding protein
MAYVSPTNSANLIGRLTRDPELRSVTTASGDKSVLTLGLAVRRALRSDDDDAPTADFFDVTVWGALAENCAAHLQRGRLVAVAARLEPKSWESGDGDRRRGMEIVASGVDFLDRPKRDAGTPDHQSDVPAAAAA